MAERRMFAKTIIDSDAFLEMPTSSQALYFHLSMRADDDGFINNPKKIQRMTNCSEDDFRLLIAKRFIFPFDSGVVVIKHWRIHNYIQKDRYKETVYQDEKMMLSTKENGAYTLCIQDVSKTEAQDRLGEDRIELGEDSPEEESEKVPFVDIGSLFNSICRSLPVLKTISESRKTKIRTRWKELKCIQAFEALFYMVEESDFLTGKTTDWKCTFDWLMENDKNYNKVLEGQYANKGKKPQKSSNPYMDAARKEIADEGKADIIPLGNPEI